MIAPPAVESCYNRMPSSMPLRLESLLMSKLIRLFCSYFIDQLAVAMQSL